MSENASLFWRALASGLFDWTLAWACGLLLAQRWLRRSSAPDDAVKAPPMQPAATLMLAALALQFSLLTLGMADSPNWSALREVLPLVAAMHAGRAILLTLTAASLLLLLSFLKQPSKPLQTIALILVAAFHSAVGHAASHGDFTLYEILQFFHLTAMALWTGGVLVTGFAIAPRFAASPKGLDATYLRALSTVATYSVAVVLLTGAIKGWLGLEGDLPALWRSGWGLILCAKLALVAIALALGLLHRRWIAARNSAWTPAQTNTLLQTLRAEAICLTLVILLSGWLANVDPS